ncbi:hypothetical protein [Haliangium sp.]|uniref:hypothetical protein n=1 Tax=Haliangium sp. TaxID=2663208 RepID=UPI003D0EE3DF
MSFAALAPSDVRDYATSLGWSLLREGLQDRLFVFAHPDMPRRQIAIPMDTTVPDYAEAVERAVGKLAEMHRLPVEAIVHAITSARADGLRYRVMTPLRDEDSLPLAFAASLVQGAQRMLSSAACTVIKPQVHHPRLHRAEAQVLVDHARFHQTAPGSFVLRVSCPVHALDAQATLPMHHQPAPFVRVAMLAINRALQELVEAVEVDRLDELVERTRSDEAPLLSSNLCEAVTYLYSGELRNDVELGFAWAASVPRPTSGVRDVIRIQGEHFERIEEVRRALRSDEDQREDTFVGTVERLDGEMGVDGRRSGDVIVALLPREGEVVRAKLTLDADQYERATQAHLHASGFVRVRGRLHPGRQPRSFTHLQEFTLI